jgi:hypothetical protein
MGLNQSTHSNHKHVDGVVKSEKFTRQRKDHERGEHKVVRPEHLNILRTGNRDEVKRLLERFDSPSSLTSLEEARRKIVDRQIVLLNRKIEELKLKKLEELQKELEELEKLKKPSNSFRSKNKKSVRKTKLVRKTKK